MRILWIYLLAFMPVAAAGQFAPAAGEPGSTALHKDSAVFFTWAAQCTVTRGYQNISDPSLGKTSGGTGQSAVGKAGENGVVSLGDGGEAVCEFAHPLVDMPGWDFAVFENGFGVGFLELAFVEVSSDGTNFYRFPATSLTDTSTQVESFGTLDPAKLNNLAGKYRALYGTPFDLAELDSIPGLDLQNITHVKVIDVVGSINSQFATHDHLGNKVNDPWPTEFDVGGFDLDAIGVVHAQNLSLHELVVDEISAYPNPARDRLHVEMPQGHAHPVTIELADMTGRTHLVHQPAQNGQTFSLDVSGLPDGVYALKLKSVHTVITQTIIVRHAE